MRTAILASALAFVVFSPVVATASADASPYRADEDKAWAREERTLEFSHDENGFSYQSHRVTDLGEDLIEGDFVLNDATLTYRFISTEPDNETTIETEVQFARLVEYRDANADGRYGLGDQPVQTIRMADIEGATLNARGGLTDEVHRPEVVYPLDNGGLGVGETGALGDPKMTIEFVLTSTTHVERGQSIQPTQAWFTVRITDFRYQDNDTSLALVTDVTSNRALEPASTDVAGTDGFHDVVYRWQPGSSSGVLRDVHLVQDTAHGEDAPQNADVIFSYAQQTPDAGHTASVEAVRYQAQTFAPILEPLLTGDWRFYSVGILISLAAVAGPAYARLRRDR